MPSPMGSKTELILAMAPSVVSLGTNSSCSRPRSKTRLDIKEKRDKVDSIRRLAQKSF